MKHILSLIAATGLCLVAVQAHAQTAAADRFLTKAIEGNLGEVAMGDLAIVRGATEKVKAYGEMLKADHAAANEKALQIAASANVTAPSEPSKEAKAAHARLSKLEGAAFDKAFAKAMVDDHKKDIASFTKALRLKDAPEVVGFANETLPHLRDHLRKAQALR
jgi:putative membrane protein